MKRALQPVISDVSIAWDLAKGWTVHQIPSSLPPLFSGDRLVVFGLLKSSLGKDAGEAAVADKETTSHVRLRGLLDNSAAIDHVIRFIATLAKDHDQARHGTLHCLSAKSLIQEKQDEYHDASRRWKNGEMEAIKDSVIITSKAANVISKLTSFVAIDKDNRQPVSRPMKNPMHMVFHEAYDSSCSVSCISDYDGECFGRKRLHKGFLLLDADICESDDICELDEEIHGSLAHRKAENYLCEALSPPQAQKRKESPPVLALITLQKASGSWDLTGQLVSLCGTGRDVLIKGCPKEIAVDTGEGKLLWATALALVLLMGKFLDQKDEWEMIAEKGSKWMKKNLSAGAKYDNVLAAAATAVSVKIY